MGTAELRRALDHRLIPTLDFQSVDLDALLLFLPQAANVAVIPYEAGPWAIVGNPQVWLPFWYDERLDGLLDAQGRPMRWAVWDALLSISAVAPIGWYIDGGAPYANAWLRFHWRPQPDVCTLFKRHHPYPGWPDLCSMYFAATSARDYYLNHLSKPQFGSNPLPSNIFSRILLHAVETVGFRWFPEQSTAAPTYANRNPLMSHPIDPVNYETDRHGNAYINAVAGHDLVAMGRWRRYASVYGGTRPSGWVVMLRRIGA